MLVWCGVMACMATAAAFGPELRAQTTGRVWPSPPETARVRFVRAFDPVAARGPRSLLSRFVRILVGGSDDPQMLQPYGIAVGSDRRIYVADTVGRAIHVYNADRSGYSTIKVDGESLIGVAVAAGRIFVTDSLSGRVICLSQSGRTLWTRGRRDGFMRPTGLAAAADRVFVVDTLQHRIVPVGFDGTVMDGFGAQGIEPGQFNFPTNIARGADGRLYVTDTMNFRVQVFDAQGRFLRMFGKLGDGSGDLNRPKGIAVDSDQHIYVVEGLNDVVQIFDEEGRLLLGFGESGSGEGQFWLPTGVAIANDVVYVADSANRRVEVFEYLKERQ